MIDFKPRGVPADPFSYLIKNSSATEITFPYREAVGSLMFASICTRPHISFAVNKVVQFSNNHDHSLVSSEEDYRLPERYCWSWNHLYWKRRKHLDGLHRRGLRQGCKRMAIILEQQFFYQRQSLFQSTSEVRRLIKYREWMYVAVSMATKEIP